MNTYDLAECPRCVRTNVKLEGENYVRTGNVSFSSFKKQDEKSREVGAWKTGRHEVFVACVGLGIESSIKCSIKVDSW